MRPFPASALTCVNFCHMTEIANTDSFRGVTDSVNGFYFSGAFCITDCNMLT
jgi:hypothetical protein